MARMDDQKLGHRVLGRAGWSALHAFQHGFHVTALNGIQGAIMCSGRENQIASTDDRIIKFVSACIDITLYEFGVVSSAFLLGGLSTAVIASSLADKFGRRTALRVSSLLVLTGCVTLSMAPNLLWAVLARFCIGGGCGIVTVVTPLYLSETAPPLYKNRLGIANQSFIVLGVFLTQSLALVLSKPLLWRLVPLVSAIISLALLGSSIWVEESQVWLQSRRKAEPMDADHDQEVQPLIAITDHTKRKAVMMTSWELLRTNSRPLRHALYTVLLVQFAQQVCGISPVMYYSSQIMSSVFPTSSKIIALIIAAVKIPVTFSAALLLKQYLPKRLLMVSAATMSFAAFLLAVFMNFGWALPSSLAIIAFVLGFSIGLGPVTWVVIGDVMPPEAASAAGSLGLALNWSTNFIVGVAFLPLRDLLAGLPAGGIGNIFFLFSITCLVACLAISKGYVVARPDHSS